MDLPTFKYHPDPIRSGSVSKSDTTCKCCKKARGYIYDGPVYAEDEFDSVICPWCIADGSAAKKFDATFVDSEAFADGIPQAAMDEIMKRTPGYAAWQSEAWPKCCDDATAYIEPLGIKEIRESYRDIEYNFLTHIIYNMQISGGAATRMLESLHRENGPTAFLFRCLKCNMPHVHIDQP